MNEIAFNLYKKHKHFINFNFYKNIKVKILDKTIFFRFFIFYNVFLLINSAKNFMMHVDFSVFYITTYNFIYFSKILSYDGFFFEF